jgi:hypothetical protein
MSTSTSTYIITRSHTAIHLTNAIEGAIAEILSHLGLPGAARAIVGEWDRQYEPAVRAWIEEGSLDRVVLECHHPSGRIEPVLEFPIDYSSDGSASLSHRHVALARQWVKLSTVPASTTVKVICQYNGWHSPQPGWEPAQRASTKRMRSVTLGTLAAGPHASASIRYYTN